MIANYNIVQVHILSWGGSHSCLSASQGYCVVSVPHGPQWSILRPKLDLQLCIASANSLHGKQTVALGLRLDQVDPRYI